MNHKVTPPENLYFAYSKKDLILYALSLGMGSSGHQDDLRFIYERHPSFSALPTFYLTFTFCSNYLEENHSSGRIPEFPPPLVSIQNVIPKRLLRVDTDLSNFQIIHSWQSISWEDNQDVSPPIPADQQFRASIDIQTISVQPKSVGTFVTSQSQVKSQNGSLLCTLQSTALVYGISKDSVLAFESENKKVSSNPTVPKDEAPIFEWTYTPAQNQALLYRIASGDSNHIHVDTSASEMMGSDRQAPLLHGLFTLGVAFRGILLAVPDADMRIRRLEAKFSQPAFVGDTLLIKIWKLDQSSDALVFQVVRKETGTILLDRGCVIFKTRAFPTLSKI